jgi:hypothetical protein
MHEHNRVTFPFVEESGLDPVMSETRHAPELNNCGGGASRMDGQVAAAILTVA